MSTAVIEDPVVAGPEQESEGAAEGLTLFHRAIVEHDEVAWEGLVIRYRGLVLEWVRRALGTPMAREEADDWVTRAFERFWIAVSRERCRFYSLPAALRYLKLCVRSVVLDDVRARHAGRSESLDEIDQHRLLAPGAAAGSDVELTVLGQLAAHDLWQAVERALPDPVEREIIYLSLVLDMKPGEICQRYPRRYTSVAEVYQAKRNALDRLRRNPQVRASLDRRAGPAGRGGCATARATPVTHRHQRDHQRAPTGQPRQPSMDRGRDHAAASRGRGALVGSA
ncbi:MAG TPA: sigma-70 family RNA polymerase sigma factor [Chloroflexota bacterium]|nr:sigma-70 family RNA polymerase sigma factor [Chloroflexota bacterium]